MCWTCNGNWKEQMRVVLLGYGIGHEALVVLAVTVTKLLEEE